MDIGELIKNEVKRQGLTIEQFAKLIHTSRANAYGIFSRPDMSTDLLIRISKALRRNFVEEVAKETRLKLGTLPDPSFMANSKLHSLGDIVERVVDGDLYAGLEIAKEREGLKALLKEYFESDYRNPLIILETGYTFGAREVVKQVASQVFYGSGSASCPKLLDVTLVKSLPAKVLVDYIDENTFDSIEASDERLNEICRVQNDMNKKFVCVIHTNHYVSKSERDKVTTFDQWGNEMSIFLERNEQFFITIYRWNRSSLLSWATDAGLHEYVLNYIRKHKIPKGIRKDYQLTNIHASFFEILMGLPPLHEGIDYPTAQAYMQSEWRHASDLINKKGEIDKEDNLSDFIQDIIDFNEMDAAEYHDTRKPQMMNIECLVDVPGILTDSVTIELSLMQVGVLSYLYNQAREADLNGLDEETIQWQFFPWLEQHHPQMAKVLKDATEVFLAYLLAEDDDAPENRKVESGLSYNISPCDLPEWQFNQIAENGQK